MGGSCEATSSNTHAKNPRPCLKITILPSVEIAPQKLVSFVKNPPLQPEPLPKQPVFLMSPGPYSEMCLAHGFPSKSICATCKELICAKCVEEHIAKGCIGSVYIGTYVETQIIPTIQERFKKWEAEKTKILNSMENFFMTLPEVKKGLIELKSKLELILEDTVRAIDAVTVEATGPVTVYTEARELLLYQQKELKAGADNDDAKRIVQALNLPEPEGMKELTGEEQRIVNNLKELLSKTIKTGDFEKLHINIQELAMLRHTTLGDETVPVTGKYVYGVCKSIDDYTKLCRYDITTGILSSYVMVQKGVSVAQIGSRVFVAGGFNPISKETLELNGTIDALQSRANMNFAKHRHTMIPISTLRIISVGGRNSLDWMGECEEYSLLENTWKILPSLNMKRGHPAVVLAGRKQLYVFGGRNSCDKIEKLNLIEKKVWVLVNVLMHSNISFVREPAAFIISPREVMVFSGGEISDIGIFDIKEERVRRYENFLKGDSFSFNPVCVIQKNVYIMGSMNGHLRVYRIQDKGFEQVVYSDSSLTSSS